MLVVKNLLANVGDVRDAGSIPGSELDAWGWCTGTTQRDGMGREEGREEGGGFRMGNTCIPVADSFWYLAKLIQLCKV